MRISIDLPFTISPIEWTAVYSYLGVVLLVAGGVYWSPRARLIHLWLSGSLCATLFGLTGWAIERILYFNANNPEKAEGSLIIGGCGTIFICCNAVASIFWKIRKNKC